MTAFSALFTKIPRFAFSDQDSDQVRLEKTVFVTSCLLMVLAAFLYGVLFLIFQEYPASLVSFSFCALAAASLVYVSQTRRHRRVLFFLLALGLLMPFAHTLLLGGIINSASVILWSLLVPIGALVFYEHKYAPWWWAAYLLLFGLAVLLQPRIQADNNLPPVLIWILFGLNVGGVTTIILLVLGYFIRQKDEAYRLLRIEEQKSENLLLNILPGEIALRLKEGEQTIADQLDQVSILFADLAGFTPLSAQMAPEQVVELLNEIFSFFDSLAEKYGVEKIHTIGDSYMAAAGVPRPQDDHAHRLAHMALDIQDYISSRWSESSFPISFRIGIHSGSVVGGVIGRKKFIYDIWGDTVNIASRMESHGVSGKIQISHDTYQLIRDEFNCQPRGTLEIKGHGPMETWFLVG
jgi:adenylate cyclase